jgi:ribosomal protein L16 Arg81 hydroxylase
VSRLPAARAWLRGTSLDARAALDALVAPRSADEFLARAWLRRPLLVRGDPGGGRLARLPGNDDLWRLLRTSAAVRREAVLVRAGRSASPGRRPGYRSIRRLFRDEGATVVLHRLERALPGLDRFSRGLAEIFRATCSSNVYLTPPSQWAFPVHWDCHEVLVVQLAGRKRWSVHSPVVRHPLEGVHDSRAYRFRAGRPILQACLEPGDVLYIPRGFPHRARCDDQHSTHLTIGVSLPTWHDLLRRSLATLASRAPARSFAPLALELDPADRRAVGARLDRLAAALRRSVRV